MGLAWVTRISKKTGSYFFPRRGDEGSQRLVDEIDIDELVRDQDAQGFHLLRELDEQNLLGSFGLRAQLLFGFGYVMPGDVIQQFGEFAGLKIAQRFQG